MPWSDAGKRRASSEAWRRARAERHAMTSATRIDCGECGRPFASRRSLASHRLRSSGCDVDAAARFWEQVSTGNGCWTWSGGKDQDGYPVFTVGGRPYRGHRWIWEELRGPIPAGMLICHRCDNPPCVNPDHLFLGTNSDNMLDAVGKGRLVPRYIGRPGVKGFVPRESVA